ncbi:ecdysone oxidase [Microplitis demolitor]|uniref:ecdysone oxidase n=1 Tax=Microplitis demolitor TaxID=69319 RepID=UPI0004400406|nr:ecdysone oxidase [Microplitis demolitor]XP_008547324.1 ecdysone oxidase [Microplitis demolitor]XP_008547333.1 ecdysone oxidase [Microplitis demolitor]XP_008547342.1 ecdysone oxidase [Microplitis demolitor]
MVITILLVLLSTAAASPLSYVTNILNYYKLYPPFPGLLNKEPELLPSYDFIIIGAGSGGSVLANRLSEISHWKILLLEAGKDEIFLTDIPLLAASMHLTSYNWGYRTEKSDKNKTNGYCLSMIQGRCNWPRGKAVGGTSVINFMIHSRGSAQDYDQWSALGNKKWRYQDVFPYFIKSERFIDENLGVNPKINSTIYGHNGYLDVTAVPWTSKLRDKFIQAGEELGYESKDCNSKHPIGFCPVAVNLRHGRRLSAAKAYLRPIRQRPNLHISRNSLVTRVIIDKDRVARGVELIKNGRRFKVMAGKEVLVSGGSLNSPQILMLSGIGPRKHLEEMGIEVKADLPVGHNLQDHVSMAALTFLVNDTVSIVESRIASNLKDTFDYLAYGQGPFTVPSGAEALAFVDTKRGENDGKDKKRVGVSERGERHRMANLSGRNEREGNLSNRIDDKKDIENEPDIELVFGIGSMAGDLSGTLRSIFSLPDSWYSQVFKNYVGHDGFSIVPVLLHPKSRGRVMLRSKNPTDTPMLIANYFDNEEDLKTLVRGIKKALEVADTRAFKKYNATLLPVQFPGCTEITFRTDEYWECVCHQVSTTLGHFVGTCKMAPREQDGVVSDELKVYGIQRLRVVDASIMPNLISGHTNAPTYMIGEKASDMIKDEWLK